MATYLKPKNNSAIFNNGDYNYQDKSITTKELNLKLEDFTDVDEGLTATTNTNTSDITTLKNQCNYITTDVGNTRTTISDEFVLSGTYDFSNLQYKTGGGSCVVMGNNAGLSMVSPNMCTLYGTSAGESLINNQNVTAFGNHALKSMTNNNSTAVGSVAGLHSTGTYSNFFGAWSGQGVSSASGGSHNSAFGSFSLYSYTSGTRNAAFGNYSLKNITTGDDNVSMGYESGLSATTSKRCVFLGAYAGGPISQWHTIAIGYGNQAVGSNATSVGSGAVCSNDSTVIGANANGGASNIAIGKGAGVVTTSPVDLTSITNTICLGDNNITDAYIKVAWTVTSDARDKTDIVNLNTDCFGLNFVNQLQPKMYKFNDRSRYTVKTETIIDEISDEEGNIIQEGGLQIDSEIIPNDGSKKDLNNRIGFIAQDIKTVEANNLCQNYSLINSNNNGENLSLNETAMIPILVNAIKQLTQIVENQEARIAALENI